MSALAVDFEVKQHPDSCSIRFRINPAQKYLVARVEGEITFKDMYVYLQKLSQAAHFRPDLNSYYDLTNCSNIVGSLSDLCAFTQKLNDDDETLPPARTALVLPVGNDKLTKLVKGIVLMTSASNIEHRYFFSPQQAEACAFIAQSPRDVIAMLDTV